jgi:2-polyprenyl-6-methoxyphenol hydroxylase-like FAD-dependent oxidoreductase
MKAVVAGGGIGGLAAAVALHRRGIDVVVLERAGQPDTAGAALSLWPNALRGLDQLGIGDQVRQHAALGGDSGIRRPDGRWLARARLGRAIENRFGDPLVIVHRATLAQLLAGQLPPGTIRYATTVTGVQPGELVAAASVHTTDGDQQADLVVAADGIRSTLRTALFPGTPGPRYAGYTAAPRLAFAWSPARIRCRPRFGPTPLKALHRVGGHPCASCVSDVTVSALPEAAAYAPAGPPARRPAYHG